MVQRRRSPRTTAAAAASPASPAAVSPSSSPPLPRMQLGLLGPDFVLALFFFFLARLRALRRRSARPAMMAWIVVIQ